MEDKNVVSTVGSEELGYLFEFKPEGVFLTVYPSSDGGVLFELSDMRQVLKDYSVLTYDIEQLARVVREASGTPQKLADQFELPVMQETEPGLSGTAAVDDAQPGDYAVFTINISKDRLSASIHMDLKPDKKKPTEEMILKALQDKNITYGIDLAGIQDGLQAAGDFVAAKGLAPVNGEDAKIERKFNLGEKGRPVANKYDQVDYKNLNLFVLVTKGDILAERIPQTQGTPGVNIYGDAVSAKNGRPKPLPAGKNTIVDGDNVLIADIDGQIVDTGSRISVDPQLSISGDVGVSTGNIDFTGGVHISGSVQAGFLVKATGDIEIKGMVSGATIEGRNIYVTGGVQGMNRGKILAREDVQANFAENAEIEASGDIRILDVVLHSTLRAGKKVLVEGKRGLITGGMLAAGEEIRAKTIGNQMNVSTRLVVGVNPMLQRKYQETCKEYAESKKRLAQITKALNTLGKLDVNKLPKERVEQIGALTRSQFPLAGKVERDEKLLRQMDAEIKSMTKGKIRASDTIYPGVKVTINSIMRNIQSEECHCTLYVEDDFVKTGPY